MRTDHVTGRDAFEYVVRRLEETSGLLAERRAADNINRVSAIRADDLERQLTRTREGEKPLRDLYKETEYVMKALAAFADGKMLRRDVARDYVADLKKRLAAADPFIVDEIPF